MSGKLVGLFLLICGALAGGALYYLQIYGFYDEVTEAQVQLIRQDNNAPEDIEFTAFQAVDADSSPIRFRACFETSASLDDLSAAYVDAGPVIPRNAPGWFECFDAEAIAEALSAGTARAYLGQKNIHYGVDRIVAVTADGRGYIWHELNDCGDKAYDGTVVGEECPPLPETNGEG
ncbi:DUF6446 family protein [Aestuariivita boseongensis]|uniref:DUF6446 family protein n=1 Tax=Aestuariivita boseongensis TaxID=1470562 RepID=UPI00067FF792|nr:DUF6446 family protein [Aestuariivita boseongensis]